MSDPRRPSQRARNGGRLPRARSRCYVRGADPRPEGHHGGGYSGAVRLDARFDRFGGHLLISCFAFDADWPTWEMHPAGDEFICLLSGAATLVLERGGVEEVVHLRDMGVFAIVPKGTWHAARTPIAARMLFVTPGEGTENKAA